MEILLDHGAVLDYEDDHVHRAASLISFSGGAVAKTEAPGKAGGRAASDARHCTHVSLEISGALRKVRKTILTLLTEALYNAFGDGGCCWREVH